MLQMVKLGLAISAFSPPGKDATNALVSVVFPDPRQP
jgi:hypothetical protein